MSRKILISPGFGAGWSTRIDAPTPFVCEYQPIIEALERGERLHEDHPAVVQFIADCKEKWKEDPYLGGLEDLEIAEIGDDEWYQVHSNESIRTKSSET